jgi:hypothetical protein
VLGAGEIARVGSVAIPAVLVARTAAVSGKPPQSSLDALVEDALVAEGARAQGLDRAPGVRWAVAGVLARRARFPTPTCASGSSLCPG